MIMKRLLAIAIVAVASFNLHAQTLLSSNQRSLEKTKAEHWMKNFKMLNGGTLAYLYGKQVLDKLASTKETTGAYIFRALENGKETLVFKPLDQDGIMFKGLAFEDGTQCPPYCTPCPPDEPCVDNLAKTGKQIHESSAVEMIEKYRAVNPNKDAFLLEQGSLQNILSWHGVEAIYFANGLDDLGEQHLILIGVDQQRQLIWNGPVYYLDKKSVLDYPQDPVAQPLASTNQRLLKKTKAEHWMKNFAPLNSGALAYLYGKQVLKELAGTKGTSGAYIFRALENGKETIVFKPLDQDGVMFRGLAFEDGTLCPPYCVPCPEGPCVNNADLAKTGKQIDESRAVDMIEKYRSINPNQDAFLLERETLKTVLSWRGVEAIYFANALDDLGEQHLILIGVDQKRQLMWDGPVYYLDKTSLPNYPNHPVAQTK